MSSSSQDIVRNRNFGVKQGHNPGTKLVKMTCNTPKLDLVKMNAYIKCVEILSIGSHDIEWKGNFSVNKGP